MCVCENACTHICMIIPHKPQPYFPPRVNLPDIQRPKGSTSFVLVAKSSRSTVYSVLIYFTYRYSLKIRLILHLCKNVFSSLQGNLYPTVGLQTPGEIVDTNFGQSPFVFNIEDLMQVCQL